MLLQYSYPKAKYFCLVIYHCGETTVCHVKHDDNLLQRHLVFFLKQEWNVLLKLRFVFLQVLGHGWTDVH